MGEYSHSTAVRYLYLPSNGSNAAFPQNTAGDWTTLLESPLDLTNGKYEVGLAEIQFIRSLPTVTKLEFSIKSGRATNQYALSDAGVSSVSQLVHNINESVPPALRAKVRLHYDETTFKVSIHVAPYHVLTIPNEWSNIFGFEVAKFVKGDHVALRSADLYQGTYSIYIYSNISRPIPVGSKTKPLLGVVSIPKGHRAEPEVVVRTYEQPMFIPIVESFLQLIRIYLCDEHDRRIHFRLEPVTVKLAIRRVE